MTATPAAEHAGPVAVLHAAAARLRQLAGAPGLTPGPWLSLDGGDRLLYDGTGAQDEPPVYVANEPMSSAANAEWIAAMHPGVGPVLARVFDVWARMGELDADLLNRIGGEETLAVARAITSKEQP
jgi:hypothetical protein